MTLCPSLNARMMRSATSAQSAACFKSPRLTAMLASMRWLTTSSSCDAGAADAWVLCGVLVMAVHPPRLQAHVLQADVDHRAVKLLELRCHGVLAVRRAV